MEKPLVKAARIFMEFSVLLLDGFTRHPHHEREKSTVKPGESSLCAWKISVMGTRSVQVPSPLASASYGELG